MKSFNAAKKFLALLVAVTMTLQSPAMAFAANAAENDENSGDSSYSEQIGDSEQEEEPEEEQEEPAEEPEEEPEEPEDEPKDDPEEEPEGEPADPENPTDPVDPEEPKEPEKESEQKNAFTSRTMTLSDENWSEFITISDGDNSWNGTSAIELTYGDTRTLTITPTDDYKIISINSTGGESNYYELTINDIEETENPTIEIKGTAVCEETTLTLQIEYEDINASEGESCLPINLNIPITVTKLNLNILDITAEDGISKEYDGTKTLTIDDPEKVTVTFKEIGDASNVEVETNLELGTDYIINAEFNSADVATNIGVTFTVQLQQTDKANNYAFPGSIAKPSIGTITPKQLDYTYTGRTVFASGDTADKLPTSDETPVTLADERTPTYPVKLTWYSDTDCTTELTSTSTFTSDTTIYYKAEAGESADSNMALKEESQTGSVEIKIGEFKLVGAPNDGHLGQLGDELDDPYKALTVNEDEASSKTIIFYGKETATFDKIFNISEINAKYYVELIAAGAPMVVDNTPTLSVKIVEVIDANTIRNDVKITDHAYKGTYTYTLCYEGELGEYEFPTDTRTIEMQAKLIGIDDLALYKHGENGEQGTLVTELTKVYDDSTSANIDGTYDVYVKADALVEDGDLDGGLLAQGVSLEFCDKNGNLTKNAADAANFCWYYDGDKVSLSGKKNSDNYNLTIDPEYNILGSGKITKRNVDTELNTYGNLSKCYDGTNSFESGDIELTVPKYVNGTESGTYTITVPKDKVSYKYSYVTTDSGLENCLVFDTKDVTFADDFKAVSDNYEINYVTIKAEITPVELPVEIVGEMNQTYGNTVAPTVKITDDSKIVEGDDVNLGLRYRTGTEESGTTYPDFPGAVGTYTISVISYNANYEPKYTEKNLTVSKATPTINQNITKYVRYNDSTEKILSADELGAAFNGKVVTGNVRVTSVQYIDRHWQTKPETGTTANTSLHYQLKSNLTSSAVGNKMTVNFTFVPNDSGNFYEVDGSFTVEIVEKLPIDDIVVNISDFTYGDAFDGSVYSSETVTANSLADSGWSVKYSGNLSDDTLTEYPETAEAPTKAGTYKVVVSYENDEYTGSAEKTFSIKPRELVVAPNFIAENKEYDGTVNATVTGELVITGLVGDDDISYSNYGDYSWQFDIEDVGTDKEIAAANWKPVIIGGADIAYCYDIDISAVSPILMANITPKPVTATYISSTNTAAKVYDGTTAANDIVYGFTDVAGMQSLVTVKGSEYASKNVGDNIAITLGTVYSYDYNYDITLTPVTGSITAAPLTVDISGLSSSFTYGTEYNPTVSISDSDQLKGGDTIADLGLAIKYYKVNESESNSDVPLSTKPVNAGSYKAAAAITNGNYNLSGESSKNFTIAKADVTGVENVSVDVCYADTAEKTFDERSKASVAGKYKVNGISGQTDYLGSSSTQKGDALHSSITYALKDGLTEADIGKNIKYTITFVPDDSTNYNTKSFTITINVTDKTDISESINVDFITTAVYGETIAAPVYSSENTSVTGSWSVKYSGTLGDGTAYSETDVMPTKVGSYKATISYEDTTQKGSVTKAFTITKKTLTISNDFAASDKVYDGTKTATVTGEITVNGIVEGSDVSVTTGNLVWEFADKNVGTGKTVSPVSGWTFTLGGDDAYCYQLTTPNAPTLTANITKKPVTAAYDSSTSGNTKAYDGTTGANDLTYKFTGVGSDGEITVTVTGSKYASKNVGSDIAITLGTQQATGDIGNYDITLAPVTGSITPAELTVRVSGSASMEYGGDDYNHSAVITDGVADCDADIDIPILIDYLLNGNAVDFPEDAGTYTITCTVVDNNNYTVKTVNGVTSFTITPKSINCVTDKTVLVRYNDTDEHYINPSDFGINVAGRFENINLSDGDELLYSRTSNDNAGSLLYKLKSDFGSDKAGKTVTYNAKFVAGERAVIDGDDIFVVNNNYATVNVKLTIKLVGKDIIPADAFIFNGVSDYVYDGTSLTDVSISVDTEKLTGYNANNKVTNTTYNGTDFNGNAYITSATAPTDPGVYAVRCEYTTNSHTGIAEKSYTISKKTVGYTGLTVKEKTYNDMTEAEVEGTAAIDGLVGSDAVAVDMSGITYRFENADIGTQIAVIPSSQPIVSGADAWKYIIEPLELTGTINKPTQTIIIGINSSSYRLDSEDNVEDGYEKRLEGTKYETVGELKNAMIAKAESTVSSIGSNVKFFDFVLKKTSGGIETEVNNQSATALIPYPNGTDSSYEFVLIHLNGNILEKVDTTNGKHGIEFTSTFSPFMLAWHSNSTDNGGSGSSSGSSGGGGSNFDDEQSNFWSSVRERIENSGTGDTVKVYAEYYDKLSWRVMQALRNNPGVTLIIDWYGGSTITIPAGTALASDAGRVYYPLSYLAEKYENVKSTLTPATNPTTGGKTTSVAAPAVELADFIEPAITPADEGIDEKQAKLDSTPIVPPVEVSAAPAEEVVDVITIDNSADSNSNRAMGFAALAVAAAAAFVGVKAFIRKREKRNI